MGEVSKVPQLPDAESICTRVVARVIEELSCIDIAPDSPSWSTLTHDGAKVGLLASYRGRSGIRRMVSFDVRVERPWLDVHYVAVLTDPESLVPHLLVSARGDGDETRVHADLLPRAPLSACAAYIECCYAPLEDARSAAFRDARLQTAELSEVQRCWGSPWALSCRARHAELEPAAVCVEAYTNHWARLMRQGTPFAAQRDAEAALSGVRHDAALRSHLFAREADPMWAPLEAAIGTPSVDMLLAALRDEPA